MTFPTFVLLADVWAILAACAPGFEKRHTRDHFRISYGGRSYDLSCGPHGAVDRAKIYCSDVRKMSRKLQISDCVIARLG